MIKLFREKEQIILGLEMVLLPKIQRFDDFI